MTELHIGFEIRTLSNLIHRRISQITAGEEDALTPHQFWVLKYLICREADQNTIQRDIEEQFSVRRSTISHMLQLMERDGYILRVPVPEDARLKKLVPTQRGINAYHQTADQLQHFEEMLQDGISQEDLEHFFRVLQKMEENVM